MRKPLLVASVLIHAGAFTALAISAMWRIDKLPLDDRGGVVASFQMPQDTGGGAAQARPKLVPKKEEKKIVKPDVTVQPEHRKDKQDLDTTDKDVGEQLGNSTQGPPGNGTGGDGKGKLEPNGECEAPPCEQTKKEEPIVEKKKEEPKIKKPVLIEESKAKRISGNSRIEAPNDVKVSMQRAGDEKVLGTTKLCVDTSGNVVSAKTAKSTGYDPYDDKLVSEMSRWRYSPYVVDGEAMPFCTYITLVYIMR
jgi:hypothetical protein